MSLRIAGLTLCGAAMLSACSGTTTVSQGAQDVSLLATGVAGALTAAEAAIPAPTPAQTAQFAQVQSDVNALQAAAAAVQSATATGTTAQQIEAAVTDLSPILVAVFPAAAPEVAAADVLVPVIVSEITGVAPPPKPAGMSMPLMSVPEARLILKGASR